MKNVFNREKEPWIRPWNTEKFDDLYNRDERFFAIVIKGMISWLNRNIVLYNKSINHFIFNTGSSYLYMESNGYEYNLSETTGEDAIYMQMPRCVITLSDISFPTEELTSPYARGNYERKTGNMLAGYNAEIRRLPLELSVELKYVLSNFNETIILLQELIDKIVFQQYYNVAYLGQVIQCSIEFPSNATPEINKIDMSSPEVNQRNITLSLKICTNYPLINTRTETPTDTVISSFGYHIDLELNDQAADVIDKGEIINNENDGYNEFTEMLENNTTTDPEIIDTLTEYENKGKELNDIINNLPEDETDLKELIEEYDTNKDGTIDENDLLTEFDMNGDGVVDADDIEVILEKIKYENNDPDSDLNMIESDPVPDCHYRIDYKDLYIVIKLINSHGNITVDYDRLTNKLYTTNNETGEVKEIDMIKYKINK